MLSRSEGEMVHPKCTALSEMLTISLLTKTPDPIPLENFPLKTLIMLIPMNKMIT